MEKMFIHVASAAIWETHKSNILNANGKWYKSIVFRADTNEIYNRGVAYGVGTDSANTIKDLETAVAALATAKLLKSSGAAGSKTFTAGVGITYAAPTGSAEGTAKKIFLTDVDGAQMGDGIDCTDFIKDGLLSDAVLVTNALEQDPATESDATRPEVPYIKMVFNTDAGKDPVRFSVKSLVDVYTGANLKLSDTYADKTEAFVAANIKAGSSVDTVAAELKKAVAELQNEDTALGERIDGVIGESTDAKTALTLNGLKKRLDEEGEATAGSLTDLNDRLETLENSTAASDALSDAKDYTDAEIQKLDAEKTSTDGTNIQVKVTEVDGKITGVSIATENYAEVTRTAVSASAAGAFAVKSGDETKLVKAQDLKNAVNYIEDVFGWNELS